MSAAVTIVVNGTIAAGAASARIAAGRVVAPLTPIVVGFAVRVSYDAASATVAIERAGKRIVVPVAFIENDVPYVALGPVVHQLGGSAVFDRPTKTLVVSFPTADPIATPTPYDPAFPQADQKPVFTPPPPPPTPRVSESANPRPRRTAIPAVPSEPVVPSSAAPTNRRR